MPKLKKKSKRTAPAPAPAAAPAAATPVRLARVAKGKKPQYFSDPAIDKLLSMTLTLMEELSVTRDRLDTVERLLASKKLLRRAEIEGWKPDPKAEAERLAARGRYVDRMMRAMHVELEEIAGRGMPKSEEEVVAAVES
ncbi:MAG: hypothetical protein FJ154_01235 [Gammaproteobacteria bacterium]|nr:hypothetical protein [Gammaproteobacteria bacterium]